MCVDNVVMEGVIQDNDLLDQVPVVECGCGCDGGGDGEEG